MSRKKRVLKIISMMLIAFSMATAWIPKVKASHEPSPISLRWANVKSANAGISASGKTITTTLSVQCIDSNMKIDGTLYLEKKTGNSWSSVTSWTVSATGLLRTSKTLAGIPGTTYRARFDIVAGKERVQGTSPSSCTL